MDSPQLHIQLLGGFLMAAEGADLATFHAPRLQALIALLILTRDIPQPRRHIAFSLWPNSSEAQAQTNLRNLLHQLRHLLPHADASLVLDRQTVQWRVNGALSVDVVQFEQALCAAEGCRQRGDLAGARIRLEEAIDHYRGDLLPACYDDWIFPARERLRRHFVDALEQLIALLEERRDYAAATRYAQRLAEAEPLHESACLRLMRLHSLNGDRAAALQAYRTCAANLRRDLATEPGEALQAAHAELICAGGSTGVRQPPCGPALIGRSSEWTQLVACWSLAGSAGPRVALLSGETGIGKTWLAEALLRWAEQHGAQVARAHCYPAEGELPYAPVVAWLREAPFKAVLTRLGAVWRAEIARLAPELLEPGDRPPPPAPPDELWQRRLFEALARAVLEAAQPLMLLLDDIQWCDHATLEWLHFLLRYDPAARLLLVATERTEDRAAAPLHDLLTVLREQGQLVEIELGPLSAAETADLAVQLGGRPLPSNDAEALFRETEGNPLFVVETIRAERDGRHARGAPGDDAMPPRALPPRVGAILEARLAKLSPPAQELAGVAAAIGRVFDYGLLRRVACLDEARLVAALDELCERHIVRERGEQEYDFRHDGLRELAYRQLSVAHRRLVHQRVAEAIEARPAARAQELGIL